MKVCVYGAGAVGGHIAARLAAGDTDISLGARGEQLSAIRQRGLVEETHDGRLLSYPVVTDRSDDLGPQDVVIFAVKAPAIAESISSLLSHDGLALFVINGTP
jgi:2-dehydropantoate 2-reductase